ncbi:MAG: hypothetical protein FE78DRAFT_135674 [Acidomyces sp. 'richmondensis']|nr:MAG: hypothetical protein FE78DRAFT_135674 [Acidomyces sp. 'richmondensis']
MHNDPPGLERLVVHFVAAKRSLACISHVQRAGELVSSSRSLIEETAVLNARNEFAWKGVDEQLETLEAIRDGIEDVGTKAMAEFGATVKVLDETHTRLENTLDSLRRTAVDSTLPKPTKMLYDFIDESSHKVMVDTLQRLMDDFHGMHTDLNVEISKFNDDIRQIGEALLERRLSGSGPQEKRTIYDEPPPNLRQLFKGMENNAVEMAHLLQSLTSHYDLCVTALKHTEGGGEAAKLAIQQAEELSTKNARDTEESLYGKTVPEPMDLDHRREMLKVLEGDAEQLDEVVVEIREYSLEIEEHYSQLSQRAEDARKMHQTLCTVLSHFHQVKSVLPQYIANVKHFQESWHKIRASMMAKTNELAELTEFYNSFSSSYAKVLAELERRKAAETQMRKLALKVQKEFDRLYEADEQARMEFMDEVREFLPRDIWPGAGDSSTRWVIRPESRGD